MALELVPTTIVVLTAMTATSYCIRELMVVPLWTIYLIKRMKGVLQYGEETSSPWEYADPLGSNRRARSAA